MAGVRCIQNILEEDPNVFDITIFGKEPHVNYSRIMLSSILQGGASFDDIVIHPQSWYEENNIQLFYGEAVIEIDNENKQLKTDKNRVVDYDKIIIATGSNPVLLPIPGVEKDGVMTFRTIEDCKEMMESAAKYQKAVVIGGGLLGLEAASGLLNLGMEVDVVHRSSYMMERQLDHHASWMLQKELESQGIHFLMEKETEEIIGKDRAEGLLFKDGSTVHADLVVMAVGVRPNIQLAKETGLKTNRGIIVNHFMATSFPDIYAVGECIEHEGVNYGLVRPLYEQGEILAKHLCGKDSHGYQGSVVSTQLKISGVDVFSAGEFNENDMASVIQLQNEVEGIYKKVVFQGNKVIGAVLFGEIHQGPTLLDMISKKKLTADADKASLLETPDIRSSYAASMSLSELVCTCNIVSKETIIDAVQKRNLSTVEEIKQCTKASSSCGGCQSTVAELLKYVHSDYFNEDIANKSMCSCTDLSEEEVVSYIQIENIETADKLMKVLNWNNNHGCSICRPALEYYFEMIYPEYEVQDNHMNAQLRNDGTYEIVPQVYGGVLDSNRLNKLLAITKSYPSVKLTIGTDQKIHILGVRKTDLDDILNMLDIPTHSSVVNMVDIIHTSTDKRDCTCKADSIIKLAEELQRSLEYLKFPHQVKLGISCHHQQSELILKDIAVIQVNNTWELYVGGRNQISDSGQLLTVLDTVKEAAEMIYSFCQYYRESANYLESVRHWIERIGVIPIREALFDQEIRHDLLEMMESSILRRKFPLVNI